jgi:predicted CXXCH cytochrome family protein
MEELFNKSPHQPAFAAMGVAGCVVCHANHAVEKPSPGMLAGAQSVCAQCHEAKSTGGAAAAEMAGLIRGLDRELRISDRILERAADAGMEVSEAALRQQEARENLVKARVAVHAFRVAAVAKPVEEGLRIAAETRRAGVEALKERDRRRVGLGVSLVTIAVTIAGLWLAIRSLERQPQKA